MALEDVESLDGNVDLDEASASPSSFSGVKRKHDSGPAEPTTKKRKKQKKAKKPKDAVDEDLDEDLGINVAIGRMDGRLLCDIIAQKTKRFEPELSAVELDDIYVPAKAVRETSDWSKARSNDLLPDFLKSYTKGTDLTRAPRQKGHPHTIVVAAAGLRAADLIRVLRAFETKDVKVAKLFAKHIKLKEATETCKKLKMNIGVGTPHRIHDLLDHGALSSKQLQRIVIDASHIDQKKRGILDMKETLLPLVKLLTREEFKQRYGATDSPLELVFF